VEGYRKWLREMKPKILVSELKVKSEPHDMTGTLDALAEIDGWLYVIDWKSGKPMKANRWQLALYALLWSLENGKPAPKRAALYLQDGDYRWAEFKNRTDVERAKALITAAQIKMEVLA
ncbi:MAG: PD-(D/E)XK nuclease family protein, partial [Vicinamibacteria bacterium]